jgi:nicotinamide mononucleotide transporter
MLEELLRQIAATGWVEWLGTLSGIAGVWASIKERVAAWPLFITCYASYIYLSGQAGLHGALLMNAVFVAISLYGWACWTRPRRKNAPALRIGRIPPRKALLAVFLWAAGTAGIGWLLDGGGASRPYLDAFASCGGFVAQWMLSRKYIETWICWTVSDLVFIYLWASQGYWMTVLLFTVFIGLAIRGWIEWSVCLKRDVT